MIAINTLGFFFSVFLGSILIITSKFDKKQNLFIGMLMLTFSIPIFNSIRILAWGNDFFEIYETLSNYSLLLVGPLLYLYVKSWNTKNFEVKKEFVHFIPFCFLFLLQLLASKSTPKIFEYISMAAALFLVLSMSTYLVLAIRIILKSSEQAKKSLLYTVYGFGAIWHINLFLQFSEFLSDSIGEQVQIYATLILSLLILALSYTHWLELLKKAYPTKSNFTLNTDKKTKILKKIQSSMSDSKPYLDNNFSLKSLSILIDEPISYISHCINTEFKMSFPKYLAHLRVKDFVIRAQSGNYKNHSIEGLSKEVGFNSTSTFNRAFKQNMKMLPSEFLMSLKDPKME